MRGGQGSRIGAADRRDAASLGHSRSSWVNDSVNETGAAHCPLVPINMPVEQGDSVSCRLVLVGLLAL
jgi:hypothetical protein